MKDLDKMKNSKTMKLRDVHPKGFNESVFTSRLTVMVIFAVCFLNRAVLDEQLSIGWNWLREQWWFKHDSFEPVWATLSFSLWTNVFMFMDYYMQDKFGKFLINPKNREPEKTYDDVLHRIVGFVYLAPLLVYDVLFPRRMLPEECPSFFQLLLGLALGIFVYDLIFFPLHILFHKGPKWLQKLHKRHHEVSPLVAPEVIRHSLIDGTMQVVVNIVTLKLLRLHPLNRAVHNFVITYLLTEIHAGYDMPWMLHNIGKACSLSVSSFYLTG